MTELEEESFYLSTEDTKQLIPGTLFNKYQGAGKDTGEPDLPIELVFH